MIEDAELLRRYVAEGSENAFSEFVRRYAGLVYGSALRRVGGNRELAAEVTQTVFVQCARKSRALQRHPTISGWLHRSTRFAAIDALRALNRREKANRTQMMHEQAETSDEHRPLWSEIQPLIDGLLDRLGDADRAAVIQRFLEDRSYQQVGAALGISEDTARKRVDRALAKLQAELERRGIQSSAAALGLVLAEHAVEGAPKEVIAAASSAGAAASVGGGGALALANLQFIMCSKITVGLIGSIAVLAIGGAWYEYGLAEKYRQALLSADRRNARSAATIRKNPAPTPTEVDLAAQRARRAAAAKPHPAEGDAHEKILADLNRGTIQFGSLADVGQASPRSALESFFWAITDGSTADISKLIVLTGAAKDEANALFASLPVQTQAEYQNPEQLIAVFAAKWGSLKVPADGSLQITNEKAGDSDSVVIYTQQLLGPNAFGVQNGPNGWRLVVPKFIVDGAAADIAGK